MHPLRSRSTTLFSCCTHHWRRAIVFSLMLMMLFTALLTLPLGRQTATVAAQSACVTAPADMIAWYPGNGNANDVQSSFNGAPPLNFTYGPGRVAQAFQFDGTSGVTVAHTPALNPNQFTIEAWVNPSRLNGDVEIIVNKENNPFQANQVQYEIGIRGPASPGGTIPVGNLAFFIGNLSGLPSGYSGWADGGGNVPLNTWTHIALTFDGTTARTYLNGTLARTIEGLSGTLANSTGPFKIGTRSASVIADNPNAHFDGLIDEVAIYGRALRQSELQGIINAGSAGRCSSNICPRPTFLPAQNFPTGILPSAITAGDFNNDGRLDVATSDYQANTISVLLNGGPSSFGAPSTLGAGTAPQFITNTDLNGDNRLDLIVANALDNNIGVYFGNGNGTFTPTPRHYSTGLDPRAIAIGDFNNDGRPDVAVANLNAKYHTIYLNNGVGGLIAAPNVVTPEFSRFIATADFNGDGRLDLVAVHPEADSLTIALGNGNGTFNNTATYFPGKKPQGLTFGDFNGDGTLDLAVANTLSYDVSILLGNGNGSFGGATNYPLTAAANPTATRTSPASIVTADLNGDGKLDLITSNYTTHNVTVLQGNGMGSFTSLNSFAVGKQPQHLVSADFNNDGTPDIATGNLDGTSVSLLTNSCTPVPLNSPPTIAAVGSGVITRQQGSASTLVTLAEVGDAETLPNNLEIAVDAPAGIRFENLTIRNGLVTANVWAACSVPVDRYNITLTVRDDHQTTNTANLTINVTANTPPTLGTYPAQTNVALGSVTTIAPAVPPSDNGVITGITASAPNASGTLSVNPTTGVLTINNPTAFGTFPVTLTATDNCGLTTTQTLSFTVTKVTPIITITGAPQPYAVGQPATFTATILPNDTGAGVATGTVMFYDGNTLLGTATLNAMGQAVLTTSALTLGPKQITARYSGDAKFEAATSAALVIAVARSISNVSAANYQGDMLAPEQMVAAFGTNLANGMAMATSLPLPTTLAGTIVRVRDSAGAERLAPLFFVSPQQVNYLIPQGTANGTAVVTIVSNDGSTSVGFINVSTVAPSIFTANASGTGAAAAEVLQILPDGTRTFLPVAMYDNLSRNYLPIPINVNPAPGAQVYLVLYGTGLRNNRSVTATIGGVSVPVTYGGRQGSLAGLDQVNILLPASLAGRGEVDAVVTVDGKTTNPVKLNIR